MAFTIYTIICNMCLFDPVCTVHKNYHSISLLSWCYEFPFEQIRILIQTKFSVRLDISQHCTQLHRLWCDIFLSVCAKECSHIDFLLHLYLSLAFGLTLAASLNISVILICNALRLLEPKILLFFQMPTNFNPNSIQQNWMAWIRAKCI